MKIRPVSFASFIAAIPSQPAAATSPGWDFSGLGETHLVIGSPSASGRGEVQIYHDSSPTPLRTIRSPARRDLFGIATAGAGDLDGDGFDDLLVGAPLAGQGLKNYGMVHAYSGATGLEIFAIPGFGDKNYFGRAVAGAGDVNDDGVPDILVSGWIHSELDVAYGRVYIICGLEGTVLKTITSFQADDAFGYTVVSLGDLTGDGVPEIAIAAPTAQTNQLGDGAVYIFDLTASPVTHLTTADAWHVIANGSLSRDYFGSVLAYDAQMSTTTYHSILIGSVDPISYGSAPAQFIFSRHKIGTQTVLGEQTMPSQISGDVIPDGKVTGSDTTSVLTNLNQPGSGGMTNPDLDGDGLVTGSDLVVVLTNLGATSPIHALLADPSPLVSRLAELTGPGGGVQVEPGEPEPWVDPPCNDDDDNDDSDDNDDNDDGDGGPSIQPGFPGVNPGRPVTRPRAETTPPTTDGGDCDDDDTDDDDGGCSGCDIPDGAPDDADCDAFSSIDTANYVGRGLESDVFHARVTSDAWVVSIQTDSESEVTATITQPAASQNGVDYRAAVRFADTSGIAKLKWRATNQDTGVVVTKCFSVSVVEYKPVRFQYRTFIPCSVVPTPTYATGWPFNLPPFFSGDLGRYTCAGNSGIFGPNPTLGQTHRSSCDIWIASDGIISTKDSIVSLPCDDNPLNYTVGELPDNSVYARFGSTSSFGATSAIADCDPPGPTDPRCEFRLIAGATPLQSATRPHVPLRWKEHYHGFPGGGPPTCFQTLLQGDLDDGANGAYSLRTAPNVVKTIYHLHASAPIPFSVMPAIDVYGVTLELTWVVDASSNTQTIWWTFRGEHDGFPSHEAYLQDEVLGTFDSAVAGHGLFHLLSPAPNEEYNSAGSVIR